MRHLRTAKADGIYTLRESEVIARLVSGKSYKAVADDLGIGIETVRTHIKHIYRKADVQSRAQLAWKVLSHAKRPR